EKVVMERQPKGEEKKLVKNSLVSHNPSPAKYHHHGSEKEEPARKRGHLRHKCPMLASRLFSLLRRNSPAFSSKLHILVVHFCVSYIPTFDIAADPFQPHSNSKKPQNPTH